MSDLTTHLPATTTETGPRPRIYSDVTRLGIFAFPVLLALTLFTSFALRLYCLDCHGFWGDEVASLEGAVLGFPDMITGRFGWIANQTPLHYIIIWLTTLPLDPTESTVLVRLPQAVAGALTPLVIYGLGKEMFGRTQGLIAAVISTFTATHIAFSQEARPYALMAFLSALSIYTLIKAERTGDRRWWFGFAASSLLNVLNTYVALTLFIPTLLPYLALVLWRLWSRRSSARWYAGVSTLVVLAGCAAAYLDIASRPRPVPTLAGLAPDSLVPVAMQLLVEWLPNMGTGGAVERVAQIIMLLALLFGIYSSLTNKAIRNYGGLCLLLLVAPVLLVAYFSSAVTMFHRYVLFLIVPYTLLISNGIGTLLSSESKNPARVGGIYPWLRGLCAVVPIAFLLYGAYNYNTPEGHKVLSYRQDFRGAAHYLTSHVQPQDMVIFIDEPALGYLTTTYYSGSQLRAQYYDARDPRMFRETVEGSIYWVLSSNELPSIETTEVVGSTYKKAASFNRVLVLREDLPTGGVLGASKRMAELIGTLGFHKHTVSLLRGDIYQAEGEINRAVEAYREADIYYPVGGEYLDTARGFQARGDKARMWREALIAKANEPARPTVHIFLAEQLRQEGFEAESQAATRVGDMLKNSVGSK